jgi:hypothetical protein
MRMSYREFGRRLLRRILTLGRTLFPAVKEVAEPDTKKEDEPEATSGEFHSSDADITNTPEYLPTEKNPRNPHQQPIKTEAPEPNDEPVVANATTIESTNLNDSSSTTTKQINPEISQLESNDRGGTGGGADRDDRWTSLQAGDEAETHTTGENEPSPAKRQKIDSEGASERGDAVESTNEGWQDVGAASSVLGAGVEDEGSVGIGGREEEDSKIEGEKAAFVLPVLSENRDTYEDVQRRVAEARERRVAAGAGGTDTINRLGKDW